MWVCLCKAVPSGKVIAALEAGARTVKDIGEVSGAGTDCGRCTRTIYLLREQHLSSTNGERAHP